MRRDKTYNEALMLLKYYYRFFYNVKKVSRKKMIENIRLFFDEFRYLPDCKVLKSLDWSKRFDKNNLQVLCEDCNLGKSNGDSIDWRLTS